MLVSNLFSINEAEIQVLDAERQGARDLVQSHQSYIGQEEYVACGQPGAAGYSDNEEEIIDEDGMRKKIIAKPVTYSDKIVGAVYIVASMKDLYETIDRINRIFMSGC